jgi:high-affinity Fe2+/Pb2+ permease
LLGFESGWLVSPAWSLSSGIWAEGTFYDFMKGFFGWHKEAENVRLIAYFAYLVPVSWLYLRKNGSAPAAPAADRETVAAQ